MSVTLLKKLRRRDIAKLLVLLETMKLGQWSKKKRVGALGHRQHYGKIYEGRFTKCWNMSAHCQKHPRVWKALKHLQKKIRRANPEYLFPARFQAIQVNRNVECGKHKDKNNMGESLIVSIGKYTGGLLCVGSGKFQLRRQPALFNGAENEHWNTPSDGLKFSIIYYNSKIPERPCNPDKKAAFYRDRADNIKK